MFIFLAKKDYAEESGLMDSRGSKNDYLRPEAL